MADNVLREAETGGTEKPSKNVGILSARMFIVIRYRITSYIIFFLQNVFQIDKRKVKFYAQYVKNTLEHISFRVNWDVDEKTANLLGQCYAYINAIINTPIRPDYYRKLLLVSLNKGALATTAIEGNTLTEDELVQIQNGRDLAPSKKYLQREVENILAAFNIILEELVREKTPVLINPELIKRFNEMVGRDIGESFGGCPGQFRRRNVTVGSYRPPSFEMVDGLIREFCNWLIREFHYDREQHFDEAIIEAIVAHVYIAWIHPFLDGNGRTARLLEFYLLMRAGVPSIASHILSNHYNDTRSDYYRQLQHATETGSLSAFIKYALMGFRDGLENIIAIIHQDQTEATWNDYVNTITEKMRVEGKTSDKVLRRIQLLAYYIPADRFYSPDEIAILNTKIAEEYRALNPVTLRRDLEMLVEKTLLLTERNNYRANLQPLHSFLPETSVPIRRHY